MSLRTIVPRLDALAATMTGLVVAAPAYALPFNFDPASLQPRDWVLMAALALLAIALAVRVMRRDRATDVGTDRPDLRWWRNP